MPSNSRNTASSTYDDAVLDATNVRLLAELERDARLSLAELGRRVSLSAPAVAERIQRLERAGVIRSYRAELDPKALGYPLAAVVRIKPTTRQFHKIVEIARTTPEVVECHRITGEDCFLLTVYLRSMDDLEPVIDRFVPLGQTTTSLIQSTPIPRRPLTEIANG